MTAKSVREQAIEAAARAAFETEYPRYSETAVEDSNRWSWLGDLHGEAFKDTFRVYATAALAAAVPVLLNDLAASIEAMDPVEAALAGQHAFNDVAAFVRAAAEGWGQ